MKQISNKTWKIKDTQKANDIKKWLLANGGIENIKIINPHELWRIKYKETVITFYKSGSLYITDSNDISIYDLHKFIDSSIGPRFVLPTKKILIGCDETGKGEVIGNIVLVGTIFPSEISSEIENQIGVSNSKSKHTFEYWDNLFNKIVILKNKGLNFIIEKISPEQIDKNNINKLLDATYKKIISQLIDNKINLEDARIVIDDYGVGFELNSYLQLLSTSGAEIVKIHGADDKYLESRLASIISKKVQQELINNISKNPDFQISGLSIGSGNSSDLETINWLKAWKKSGKEWPWFIKKSFKNIKELDNINLSLS